MSPGRSHDASDRAGAVPLAQARLGQALELVRVVGGRCFQHRMAELGLVPGVRLSVVSRGRPGPFIVELRRSRFVVGQGMTDRIFVRPA